MDNPVKIETIQSVYGPIYRVTAPEYSEDFSSLARAYEVARPLITKLRAEAGMSEE